MHSPITSVFFKRHRVGNRCVTHSLIQAINPIDCSVVGMGSHYIFWLWIVPCSLGRPFGLDWLSVQTQQIGLRVSLHLDRGRSLPGLSVVYWLMSASVTISYVCLVFNQGVIDSIVLFIGWLEQPDTESETITKFFRYRRHVNWTDVVDSRNSLPSHKMNRSCIGV